MRHFKRAGFVVITIILMFFTALGGRETCIPEAVAAAQSATQEEILKKAAEDARRMREEAEAARKKAEDEAAAERKRKEDEATAARKKAEAEAAAARKKAEDEAAAAERTRQEAEAAIWKSFDTDMTLVEGGTFTMGCTPEQKSDCKSGFPSTQEVTLNDFYIGKFEVTQAQWWVVMGNNPSSFKGDNLPVEMVSWNDVQEFINRLNQKTGGNYRLPTEAEWEYTARGGNQSHGYEYSGSNDIGEVAWYVNNSSSATHPVGANKANELGIHDMSGNVAEWVNDWVGDYSFDRLTNPLGPSSGSNRVIRGGSFNINTSGAKVAARTRSAPDDRRSAIGFRLARRSKEAEEEAERARIKAEEEAEVARERLWKEVGVSFDTENVVFVQGGVFAMGCTPEQGKDCANNEKPAHQVTLSDFYIGKYEVTQAQWQNVMGSNPSIFKGDDLPVENVTWNYVEAFIKKLNAMTGGNYRLPTEAEWEYAARGGSKSQGYKYSGGKNIKDVGWYKSNSGKKTHPASTKKANELGIYDMSGNVWEWVNDWYDWYVSGAQTDPQGPSTGSYRVIRGGSWYNDARNARVSTRRHDGPDNRHDALGFRLARSLK